MPPLPVAVDLIFYKNAEDDDKKLDNLNFEV